MQILLKDVIKIKHGYAFKGEHFTNQPTSYIVVTPGNFTTKGGFQDTEKFYDTNDFPKEFILKDNDLIVTMTDLSKMADTIGFSALVPKNSKYKYLHNQRIGLVDVFNSDFDRNYIYWLMRSPHYQKTIANSSNGATVHHTSPDKIYRYKFEKINLTTQIKIANILSTYDDLIENNNKRIKLLEKMAENLYKEWFVRFRFPGYKNAEFESGIPKGWEILKVKNICRVKSGFAFKSQWWQDIGIPVIKIKDIKDNTIDLNDLSYVSKENADKAKQFYVNAGDLLIAMTGATIGKIALVPYFSKITVNQRVGKFFLGKNPLEYSPFLFCLFLQEQIQDQITQIASSNAAQPNISPFDIEKLKFVGEMNYISRFNKLTEPMFKEILTLRVKNKNLTQQRDLLLPRLMSGKLEVN